MKNERVIHIRVLSSKKELREVDLGFFYINLAIMSTLVASILTMLK
jgi:hypothetical protein